MEKINLFLEMKITKLILLFAIGMAIGMSIGDLIGGVIGDLIGGVIGGAIYGAISFGINGLIIGMFIKIKKIINTKQLLLLIFGFTISGAISRAISRAIDMAIGMAIYEQIGWVIGGVIVVAIYGAISFGINGLIIGMFIKIKKIINTKQLLLLIFGFTISGAISGAIGMALGVQIGVQIGGVIGDLIGWRIGWVIGWVIGGAISGAILGLILKNTHSVNTEKIIILKHLQTKYEKKVEIGFSWTTFFFGYIIPLIRGDVIRAIVFFIIGQIIYSPIYYSLVILNDKDEGILIMLIGIVIAVVYSLIIGAKYNNMYLDYLKEKGYVKIDEYEKHVNDSNNLNCYDEVEKLNLLREKGILTEEEFQRKKKEILGL